MMGALALLAALSALVCDLPRWAAWTLATVALAHGLRLVRRERRRPGRLVVIADAGAAVSIDGVRVEAFAVHWRGPLAFARWRDGQGRARHLVWWPDTLRRAARRELRLAAAPPPTAPAAHSMAT